MCHPCISNYVQGMNRMTDPLLSKKAKDKKKLTDPVRTEAEVTVPSQCSVLQRSKVKKITEYSVMKSFSLRNLKQSSIRCKMY